MNNHDVIQAVSQQCGVDEQTCQQVVKLFETHAGAGMLGKLFGSKLNIPQIIQSITPHTDVSPDVCKSILSALENVIEQGIASKLGAKKK